MAALGMQAVTATFHVGDAIEVMGFKAEFRKEQTLVDNGDSPYQRLVVASYNYCVTIHGDLGPWFVYHFDGRCFRWQRVSWDGESGEYVATGVQP